MPIPTEQHAQDQRSDARKQIDMFLECYGNEPIMSVGFGTDETYLNAFDISAVLAEADRDRQFAEAVIAAMDNGGLYYQIVAEIQEAHERIYGAPCTKEKS